MAITANQKLTLNTLTPGAAAVGLGDLVQTMQVDIAALQTQTQTYLPPAQGNGYIGTRTVTQINALTPSSGWIVVAGGSGTPSAGTSDALVKGDVAEYDGTSWKKLIDADASGFVAAGTRLLILDGTLYSPLVTADATKIAEFDGSSNTPLILAPADGDQLTINGVGSVNNGLFFVYDSVTPQWNQTPPAGGISNASFAGTYAGELARVSAGSYAAIKHNLAASTDPLVTNDSSQSYAVKSVWINTTANRSWICSNASVGAAVWRPFGCASSNSVLAAAADRVTNTTAKTAFATTKTIPANLPQGTIIDVDAWIKVVGQNGTDTNAISLEIPATPSAVALLSVPASNLAAGTVIHLHARVCVATAGASGAVTSLGDSVTYVSGTGTVKGGIIADTSTTVDWTSSKTLTIYDTQSAASASNQVDLREFAINILYP